MVAIKRKLLHSVNSLIVFMISLLGFTTSCQDDEPIVMYGSPHATFIIKGKVTSASDNQPVRDIIVEMRYVYPSEQEQQPSQYILGATGFSHYQGDYAVEATDSPDEQTFQIRFVDTDGPLNGSYETLDTTVVFKDPQFVKGDGSWDYGDVKKTLDVKLKPIE